MFDFSQITEVKLGTGAHKSADKGLCFMEMVAWFAGEKHSDKPKCACSVLGAYGIRLNDTMPDEVRDRLLKPLVPMIAGTADPSATCKRARFLAMWAVNKIIPIALRKAGLIEHAEKCEQARTLSEAKIAADAADAAAYAAYSAAANSARYAADAADAAASATADAADAAASAYAADAAAYAAAYAADAAASATAYAAAYAADAAASATAYAAAYAAAYADDIWEIAVEGLRQAILLGKHEGFGVPEHQLEHKLEELRAFA